MILKIILIIFLIVLCALCLYVILHTRKSNKILKETFKNHSVIVYGAKGKGKDLLFQKVIHLRRKERYMSNVSYGYDYKNEQISSLSVSPNTYKDFINGNITQIELDPQKEGIDYYLSDAGIYLPCQYDSELNKKYPSFPIYYALSRHLYNSNIHMNTQNLERPWKLIREQADSYIKCRGITKLGFLIIGRITIYDKYQSALNSLNPLGSRIFNKYSKAECDQYKATNGEIQKRFYIILKKHIYYDSRYFKSIIGK